MLPLQIALIRARRNCKSDLEGLMAKRKDGKYAQRTLWYKVLNPTYTQKQDRQDFFQRQQFAGRDAG